MKYKYENEETPEERLRNKISPLINLLDILKLVDFKNINDVHLKILLNCIEACNNVKDDIKIHLDDIEEFYNLYILNKHESTIKNSVKMCVNDGIKKYLYKILDDIKNDDEELSLELLEKYIKLNTENL